MENHDFSTKIEDNALARPGTDRPGPARPVAHVDGSVESRLTMVSSFFDIFDGFFESRESGVHESRVSENE